MFSILMPVYKQDKLISDLVAYDLPTPYGTQKGTMENGNLTMRRLR